MTLRIKLILSFVVVVLVAVSSMFLLASQNAAREVGIFMGRGGMVGLDQLADELEAYFKENGSWIGVDSILMSHARGRGRSQGMGGGQGMMNQRLRLADATGNVLYDSLGNPGGQLTLIEKQQSVVLYGIRNETIGFLYSDGGIGTNPNFQNYLVTRLTNAGLIAAAITSGLAILLAIWFSYRLLKPVQQLTKAASSLQNGDLTQRVNISGKDELALLGSTFNSMASALQQAQESRKAMTADIAHELRTPLSIQRAYLEALQDGIYPLTLETLEPVIQQNYFLSHLVEDLRTLAMADAGELRLEKITVDLPLIIRKSLADFDAKIRERDIHITFIDQSGNQCHSMQLDPVRIIQVINNLLSNAINHTAAGGSIEVTLSIDKNRAILKVHDSGNGIPEEALETIFERFYRVDPSRSREYGGSGLGLSIARQLVRVHGGDITAGNHPSGGAVFSVILPINE
ncbi:MAG TPA: ATP-binding protein [Anaerolineaceae bacterium]